MTRAFFLGGEPSTNPLTGDLVAIARALVETGVGHGALSARHGLRATINAAAVPLEALRVEHFVEVADYDPHGDRLMVLGAHEPSPWAGLHALLYRAKREIGAVVQVEMPSSALPSGLATVARGRTTLEGALGVLEALRTATVVGFAGRHVVATGANPKEAHAAALGVLGGASP
ncbi:MAG TPA: class II aldolase/adducin family protein [Candidatus Thermoplasmatota archaeon]|nr:class II aldolase/adducin family protein [Candidatus Thermoplasmatota archaeon]